METIWKMLILAAVTSVCIFLQVLACFAFGNNWMPLIILVPMLTSPLPLLLLNMCAGDDMFSGTPRGLHWAEFLSSFLFSGCFAIPILLGITKSIEWGAAGTSLAGSILLTGLLAVQKYLASKDDDVKLSGF